MLSATLLALLSSSLGVGLFMPAGAHASALTTAIAGNERLCFFADVDKAGEKIGVCKLSLFYTILVPDLQLSSSSISPYNRVGHSTLTSPCMTRTRGKSSTANTNDRVTTF